MAAADQPFEPPVLLLAMPQVADPFFHRSVVLLVFHDEEGSFGLIVNRPTEVKLTEVLDGLDISWRGDPAEPAYFGGPVQPQLGSVLYAPARAEEVTTEILPGLGLTQHVGSLEQLAAEPPRAFRLCLGYAGWSDGQLMEEILRNDWLTAPVSEELLFATPPGRLWERALETVGVEPESLPSWTEPGDQGAN